MEPVGLGASRPPQAPESLETCPLQHRILASVRPGGRFTAVEAALSAREARHPHAPEAVKASNFGFAELVLAAESWTTAVSQARLIVVHGVCAQQALEGRVPRISQD